MMHLGLRLTPHGHLVCDTAADMPGMEEAVAARIEAAFAHGSGPGLLRLGAGEVGRVLPPIFGWWREFAARYVTALCHAAPSEGGHAAPAVVPNIPPPDEAELVALVLTAPMMPGAEYLTSEALRALWVAMQAALSAALREAGTDLQSFLKELNPAWNLVGRVHFNLAENRRDPEAPFAFMATYTTRLSAEARAQHLPLGQALREYAGAADRDRLLSLLMPVRRAAETCPWLRPMIDSGEIFHPLRWGPQEAARLLASVADLEQAGVVVRMPAGWPAGRPARPQVTATVGTRPPARLGLDGLLDFHVETTLDGEKLSDAEIETLLSGTDSLVWLRGRWVEVDRDRLSRTLQKFRAAEELARRQGLPFAEALRMLAGAAVTEPEAADEAAEWSHVTAGPWLLETLKSLRAPDGAAVDPGPALHGTLRPYQKAGLAWLHLLSGLKLGACLADDMGLGKTIQVLALLLVQRREDGGATRAPSLLVAPASLLANWMAEIARFAPDLRVRIVHPSAMAVEEIRAFTPAHAAELDLAITSYGTLLRLPVLAEIDWRLVILDEAQAIRNPHTKQTRAAKTLKAEARIALTGTPVENSLGDLWSIFDFINPGQLGTARQFTSYTKRLAERTHNPYGPLRELVRPYILRRLKTDRSVIADLPDKTEVTAHCHLSRRQAALYAQAVEDLERSLEEADGHPAPGCGSGDADAPQADLQPSLAMAERRRLDGGGQRQVRPSARGCRGGGDAPGEDAGLHPVPRDHGAAGRLSRRGVRALRTGPARRDRDQEAPRPRAAVPGGRECPVLRAVAEGRGHRAEFDRGLARGPFRPLVEPGGREPGDRSGLPDRPEKERPGAQIPLSRYGRGKDRCLDRGQARAVRRPALRRQRARPDGNDQ